MRIFSQKSLSLILALCFFSSLLAQKDPIKWGKIPQEQLTMTTYEADTSAAALVLCNYGELMFNLSKGDIRYNFSQHKRIKILKRSGFDEGDVSIPFHKNENIRGLDVQVFGPDGTKFPLKNSDIFEEKVSDNWSLKKFSAANLSEGAIIEYRYTIESEYFTELREWYFQENIPTLWSEYRLEIPEWFDYIALNQGSPASIHETDSYGETLTLGSTRAGSGSNRVSAKIYKTRYVHENLPALKREGFITTMRDYYTRIKFQLKGIMWPSQAYKPHMSSWPELANDLLGYESMGEQISKGRFTKHLTEAVTPLLAGISDNDEKVKIIYNYLANEVEWDGRYTWSATGKLDECFERKKATSGELNLMFIALARQFDIEAYPLLVSTRSNGKMVELYPILDQFNHSMALVKYGDQMQIVDLGNKHRPIGLPRVNAFNDKAWILKANQPQWINLAAPKRETVTMIKANLSEEGIIEGDIQSRYKGYAAVDGREEIEEHSDDQSTSTSVAEEEGEEEKGGLRERYPDIEITKAEYTGLEDPEAPLDVKYHCRIPGASIVNGNFIYLNPVILPAFEENPFKQETRTYPVDIPYTISERYVISLGIPEGYEVEELLEGIRMVLPEKGGSFQISSKLVGRDLLLNCTLKLNQTHFEPKDYPALKKFIDLVMDKQGEQIVLRKKT